MPFRVFWKVPQQVLYLGLEGALTVSEFQQINTAIIEHLGREISDQRIALVVDITQPGSTPQVFDQLRASQTYTQRPDLKFIMVVGSDKFMRLMMLLTFNLCRPSLKFYNTLDQALLFAQNVINKTDLRESQTR